MKKLSFFVALLALTTAILSAQVISSTYQDKDILLSSQAAMFAESYYWDCGAGGGTTTNWYLIKTTSPVLLKMKVNNYGLTVATPLHFHFYRQSTSVSHSASTVTNLSNFWETPTLQSNFSNACPLINKNWNPYFGRTNTLVFVYSGSSNAHMNAFTNAAKVQLTNLKYWDRNYLKAPATAVSGSFRTTEYVIALQGNSYYAIHCTNELTATNTWDITLYFQK